MKTKIYDLKFHVSTVFRLQANDIWKSSQIFCGFEYNAIANFLCKHNKHRFEIFE